MTFRLIHATANRPGAIAIIQLIGDCVPALRTLTGVTDWPVRRMRLARFEDIDEGIAVRLNDNVALLMPHGGMRVVQRLTARLMELGAGRQHDDESRAGQDARLLFPEAAVELEALMLLALSRAESPLAVDLLLDQPRRWNEWQGRGTSLSACDIARSKRLNRLIVPPVVVLAGPPNVGKSTLSNVLIGRQMSIALDMPGTTRDYIAGRIDFGGLVVDWHDTPGLRHAQDPVERAAVEMARQLMLDADLLIAMTDPANDWPQLPRAADLHVMNKCDLLGGGEASIDQSARADVMISAKTGDGIASFVSTVRERLVPAADLRHHGPWAFDSASLAADSCVNAQRVE